MKGLKRQFEIFALKIAAGLHPIEAHRAAYPSDTMKDETRKAAAFRLLKREDIQAEIVTRKNEIVTAATAQAIEEVKEEQKFNFLTFARKREILHNIASGKKLVAYEKGKKVYRTPSDADRLKAIELDNEMTGEGFRPPDPPPGGNTFNGPVYNTVVRKTVFKTRETTAKGQTFEIQPNE